LACVFFVWTKLAFRTHVGKAVVRVVAKGKLVLSASLGSTYSTRCTPILRITRAPKLISASLKTIFGLTTGLVGGEGTSLYRRVARKEKECEVEEAYHCN
jgi:hypothetical protein